MLPRTLTRAWASAAESLREACSGGFAPFGARVKINAFRLRLHAPLPPFTPVFASLALRKVWLLSF